MKVERLKEVRQSRGLTQREFAERVGIKQQSRISSIERGLHVSPELAQKFSKVLMCDVSELRTPDEPTVTFKVSEIPPELRRFISK